MRCLSVAVFVAGLAATPCAFAQNGPGVSDKEIKIGNTMPYSGPASAYSSQGKTESAFYEMINARGGINGRKITFLSYDDAYSPPKTVEQTRKLVEQDGILADFGPLGTPTNSAIQKYMNQKKVPQLFVSSGADKWNDPKNFPYTMPLYPSYTMEGKVAAKYILRTKPNGKIAILYQNDDSGKDYVKGFKQGLGDKAASMIVIEKSYEVSDPTLDSQMVAFKNSGADVFYAMSTPKFGAQAIKKAAELDWRPVQILDINATPVSQTLVPAGLENAKGIISVNYGKDPLDPQWAGDEGMKRYKAFMAKYAPAEDANSGIATYGYSTAALLVQILKQCGDDLTRANIMKQATNIKGYVADLALPGMTTSTTPDDWRINKQFQMMKFDGQRWVLFGPILTDDFKGN